MRVVVIGGGVVGLCCAYSLSRAGAEVTVLERGRRGGGASLGNAGWITPALSTPLPAPGVLWQALRWMLDPQSPLLVRPRLDPAFFRWCWRFARNATRSRFEQGTRALLALNQRTLLLFDELRVAGVDFEMHEDGLLFVALSEHALHEEWDLLGEVRRAGYPGRLELLGGESVRELEPGLSGAVTGGIYAADERHVRPETFTAGLGRWLEAAGATISEGVQVTRLARSGSGWAVEAEAERLHADRVVVAAGIWTRALLRGIGTTIPLEGAKGYSVTTGGNGHRLRRPLLLQEAKVGCSPFSGGLRLAGTLELAGEDLTLNRRRLDAILAAASRYLGHYRADASAVEWAGLRPVLPDGLPVIGRVPTADGVFVAAGHGMLGITLAPATAEALTPLVLEDRHVPELEAFRADRDF